MQVCTSLQTDNHASTPPLRFLKAERPSCRPTNSVKGLKASRQHRLNRKSNNSNNKKKKQNVAGALSIRAWRSKFVEGIK